MNESNMMLTVKVLLQDKVDTEKATEQDLNMAVAHIVSDLLADRRWNTIECCKHICIFCENLQKLHKV